MVQNIVPLIEGPGEPSAVSPVVHNHIQASAQRESLRRLLEDSTPEALHSGNLKISQRHHGSWLIYHQVDGGRSLVVCHTHHDETELRLAPDVSASGVPCPISPRPATIRPILVQARAYQRQRLPRERTQLLDEWYDILYHLEE